MSLASETLKRFWVHHDPNRQQSQQSKCLSPESCLSLRWPPLNNPSSSPEALHASPQCAAPTRRPALSCQTVTSRHISCRTGSTGGCGGFFLARNDFGRMLDHSLPACAYFFFYYFKIEISSRTLIPLFRPESVHSDCGAEFPGKCNTMQYNFIVPVEKCL